MLWFQDPRIEPLSLGIEPQTPHARGISPCDNSGFSRGPLAPLVWVFAEGLQLTLGILGF